MNDLKKETRNNTPSVIRIVEYWSYTPVFVDGEKHWFPPAIDIGEPECFACGSWDELWTSEFDTWESSWRRASRRLQRSHIVPISLGGSNDVSNLVMLCKECNTLNPHTKDREWFIKWVVSRKSDKFRLIVEVFERAKKHNNLSDEDIRLVFHKIGFEETRDRFREWSAKNLSHCFGTIDGMEATSVFGFCSFIGEQIQEQMRGEK